MMKPWKLLSLLLIMILLFDILNRQQLFCFFKKKRLKSKYNKQITLLKLENKSVISDFERYYFLLYKLIDNYEHLNSYTSLVNFIETPPTSKSIRELKDIFKEYIRKIPTLDIRYVLSREYNLFHYGFLLFPFVIGILIELQV